MEAIRARIKDAIWELKDKNKSITVKTVFDQANGNIDFTELPQILEYLESVKGSFNATYHNGYLELYKKGNLKIKNYVKGQQK